MSKILGLTRKSVLFVGCVLFLFTALVFFVSVKINSQQLKVSNQKIKGELLKQLEKSPEQPLRIVGNNDSPLQITQATVKEISGYEFTKLTEKTTDLDTVMSRPEIQLTNTSGKTITEFKVMLRDPNTKKTRVYSQWNVSINPGESYFLKRENLIKPEKVTTADKKGVRQEWAKPKADSEQYWFQFAKRSDIYIAVGQVTFEDGTTWTIKEGGDAQ